MNANVIEDLRERIRGLEGSRHGAAERSGVSTGFAALDGILAGGGLKRGTLIEWVGDSAGSGAAAFALTVAAHVLRRGGALVVIDDTGEFYPPAAAGLGIPLDRTVVVRPDARMTALWAWEQSLRCPGVAVTFGRIDALGDRLFRRLQLGAETGGGLGFLMRPPGCRSGPAWAATRIGVDSRPHAPREDSLARPLRLRLLRGQGGSRDAVIDVELSHETSDVSVVSQLADPAAVRRSAVG